MPEPPGPLRVAVISHLYPHRGREVYGVFVSEQVRALVLLGTDIEAVVVPVPLAPWPLPALSPRWQSYAAAEKRRTDFECVPVFLPRYLSFPRKLMRGVSAASAVRAILADATLTQRLRRADVLLAHTALLDGRIAQTLSSRFGIPYVVVVHGEDLHQNAAADSPRFLRDAVGGVLSGAAGVVTVSTAAATGLRHAFPAIADVRVLNNGVDTSLFRPPPIPQPGPVSTAGVHPDPASAVEPALTSRLGSTQRPLRVLSAGRLVAGKAHGHVLRGLAETASSGTVVECTIAGDGPERPALEALAAELGIAHRVRFLGAYRHGDLVGLLHACDLFALPSSPEAFGVVYLEALACGVPAVAASDGGAVDIIEDHVDGYLVPPRDPSAIARALAAFLALDPHDRAAMSAAAREKSERFTWKANAEGLSAYLRSVAGMTAPGRPGV